MSRANPFAVTASSSLSAQLGAAEKINYPISRPSLGNLWSILNQKILKLAGLVLRFFSIESPKSHLNLNAILGHFNFSAALMALILLVGGSAIAAESSAETPYTVQCEQGAQSGQNCEVDKKTFVGWRTYHAFCHQCHAQDAVGSTFAPSLLQKLQEIDKDRFVNSVANGYQGQVGVMPAWKDNPNISKRYDEIYAYLKARSDGVLPKGRPKKLPK